MGLAVRGIEGLDEAYLTLFGGFGAAWDDATVARWSANPLGMLWPEMGRGVRDVGWRRRAGGIAEAGDCYRCGLKPGEGILLQLCVAQDPVGNLKPAKDKSTERIDGIVALIGAIGRAMVAKEQYATADRDRRL